MPVDSQNKQINSVEFFPDVRRLLTAGSDDVVIWDLTAATAAGQHLNVGSSISNQATFLDNDQVLTYSETGQALVWPIDAKTWMSRACALAGRNLTTAEWRSVLPDRAPGATCPN